MMVSNEISILIEAVKLKIIAKGRVPVAPQIWEQDDDGLMYYTSLLEQLDKAQQPCILGTYSIEEVTK